MIARRFSMDCLGGGARRRFGVGTRGRRACRSRQCCHHRAVSPVDLRRCDRFTGVFAGQIESRRAIGSVSVVVKHEDLPEPGFTSNILSGAWQIQTFNRTIHGGVQSGTLLNNGDNTFKVHVTMTVAGSPNTVSFNGTLNHNTFPPTLIGQIGQ